MDAQLFTPLDENKVRCSLSRHQCMISPGQRGLCQVRENRQGRLETLVYGRLVAEHADPIEKKPLFHVLPGSRTYSIATVGCNFHCRFCQNAGIAQLPAEKKGLILGQPVSPPEVVQAARRAGCASIAYTYTEPTVFFEFALDTARLAHDQGLKNVFVTNGYMSAEALAMLQPCLDAANVDLKAFSDHFYRHWCGARLEGVQDSLRRMKALGIFIEITTLLIPGLNDDPQELTRLAEFLVRDLGPDTPWHISRFHPAWQMTDRPATPLQSLIQAREIGLQQGLRYVYTGNVPGQAAEDTLCPGCGQLLIQRRGFEIRSHQLSPNGTCPQCQLTIAGLWQ